MGTAAKLETVAIGLGVAVVAYIGFKMYKTGASAASAVGDALQYINPLSEQNVFYRLSNLPGQLATGDPNWTIGGALYDAFNPPIDQTNDILAKAQQNAAQYGGKVSGWIGYDYIDQDPVPGVQMPVSGKWGVNSTAGWLWER